MDTKELIKKLTAVPSVSGSESNLKELLTEMLEPYGKVETDALNNIFCTFGEGYHILLDAHIDEIGFAVTSVTEDGFLKLGGCGGIDRRLILGSEVSVWGREEVKGVISTLPPHLQENGSENNVPELSAVSVDIGMCKAEAEKLVSPGDKITFKRHFDSLMGNQISANCLDDKTGAASIIMALDALKKLPVKITVMLSAQEEVGTRGAKSGAYGKNVDEAIAVDVSFGYTPGCNKEECGEIGKGAMIGISPTLDKDISSALIRCAEKDGIRYQTEVMNGRTGTNADVINLTEGGIKCGLISIPLKYMHTPVEVVDIGDVESVSKLIVSYIKEKAGVLNA